MMKTIEAGSIVRVNLRKVAAFDSMPPYLSLVRSLVKKGGGTVYVASLPPIPAVGIPAVAYIRAWRSDFMGDVRVPLDALSI